MTLASADPPDHISIPLAPQAIWVERLIWVFAMSFALDYRNAVAREGGSGAGIDQLLFLTLCIASTAGIVGLGWRYLTVRPGFWLIAFWGLFMAFMLINAAGQAVQIGRAIRVALPMVFCLFGITNAHIAGCMGIRPSRIVSAVFSAACINIIWRIVQGFLFKEASLDTVRFEIVSPANDWLAAWISCAVLLRGRFTWTLLLACTVLFIGVFITITRSLIFPVIVGGIAGLFCFMLGVYWRQYQWRSLGKRLLPVGAALIILLTSISLVAVFQPAMLERWNERLFHNTSSVNLSADISYLTRRAEADAIMNILSADPVHFINGRGIGSSYYWDRAYISEITLVIPMLDDGFDDIWFAGHSTWTYSLLSGGVIALSSFVILLISVALYSLISARANAMDPGPDQWLAFLPFVATCCLISISMVANPFQERLVGIIFGMMAGLPQAFMVRSSWIHTAARPLPSLAP